MKVLVVGLVKDPQLTRLKSEAAKIGAELTGVYSKDIAIVADGSSFTCLAGGTNLQEFDVIYFWTLGTKRWEWYAAGKYLHRKYGARIINRNTIEDGFNYSPTPTLDFSIQAENDLPYPTTIVIHSLAHVDSLKSKFDFPVIVKHGMVHKGKGVYKAENLEDTKEIIRKSEFDPPFIIRQFIPNDGDIRVFVVGGKAVAAMKRIPGEGEFRSNISLGGRGEVYNLAKNRNIQDLAERAAKLSGVEIAGVDIIEDINTGKPYILEVNDGPQFTGIEKYTGANVAGTIIAYFQKSYKNK